MHKRLLLCALLAALSQNALASPTQNLKQSPSSCIQGTFTNSGSKWWKTIYLTLTNKCGAPVDFQNTTVTFSNLSNLNTSFWGTFDPLSYPDNTLQITSASQSGGKFLSTFSLHFPTYSGSNSVLPNDKSVTIIYGASKAEYVENSVSVYLGAPVTTAEIDLANTTAQPANVSQGYALVNLTLNGSTIPAVQVPWSSTFKMPDIAQGTYTISPANVTDSFGNVYQGVANPASITLAAGSLVTSNIAYSLSNPNGNIAFKVQALPSQLSGYTGQPAMTLTNQGNSSSVNATLAWNATTTVPKLVSGTAYGFSSPTITYNGYNCLSAFSPTSATANTTAPTVNLTYSCSQVAQDNINVNVSGLPSTTSSITATFTPTNGSTPVTQTVTLSNGSGSGIVKLTDGAVYNVSSTTVNGYNASYNPQPLTATANGTETISYSAASAGGRMIGYLTGWKTPPSATELANAGYTHMLVAFGVFSTSTPGQITPAFDTVSASYIKTLHDKGIKVLLSLGGALTSLPNTTVNFHQVVAAASSPGAFTQTFIQSVQSLMNAYGFDGIDIDIEHGLNAGGTFTNPSGDIAVLANIINTLHASNPSMQITLAPQTANISATSGFSDIWGNYASLIMQTYNSLEWVGVQVYNSGCMYGIDRVCYDPNKTSSPDFSVAMAADLLANWPTSLGFQPYISYLKPSQVVLGYLAPNASGNGDGQPVIPVTTIKRALQCLKTGVKGSNSCDAYAPPKTYAGFGGVFNWEVSYDQNNSYKFANGLNSCVKNGVCT